LTQYAQRMDLDSDIFPSSPPACCVVEGGHVLREEGSEACKNFRGRRVRCSEAKMTRTTETSPSTRRDQVGFYGSNMIEFQISNIFEVTFMKYLFLKAK